MEETIRPRSGLQLRKIGRSHMIVEAAANDSRSANVFSLNSTAAALWTVISEGKYTPKQLAKWLADSYGIDPDRAAADVDRQLRAWREYGLIRS